MDRERKTNVGVRVTGLIKVPRVVFIELILQVVQEVRMQFGGRGGDGDGNGARR